MNIKIKKGENFSFSQRGHNGFFYPEEKTSKILHDVEGEKMPWIGSEKKALSVPESAVLPFGSQEKKTVVWI
tara:strand:+ start:364 stop:579 length:216 start_codon:yes stop_codon:yes gene_type:complete